MPVTRSSSRQASQQPARQTILFRRTGPSGSGGTEKAPMSPSNEIIVLSSDDDEPPPKGTLVSRKSSSRVARRKVAASSAGLVHSGDVLEISSDDESKPRRSPRKKGKSPEMSNKDLQRTVKKLQEELKRSEQLLASASREVEELKRDYSSKDILSGLEEYTSCEVCAHTMWCPYTLPDCGHSFCENCLANWFGTTQAQHMMANPQLDGSRAALAGQLRTFVQMVPNLHAYGPHGQEHVRAVLAELRRHRPEYTCPSCRKEVLNKPVEDFRLKGLISQIAGMMGEMNSRKDTSLHRGSGPFDHFFAAPVLAR